MSSRRRKVFQSEQTKDFYQPKRRREHSSVLINKNIFVWGGHQPGLPGVHRSELTLKMTSIVEVFCGEKGRWEQHNTTGTPPLGVIGCASCAIGHKIYYFGGQSYHNHCQHNSLHELDTDDFKWTMHLADSDFGPMKKISCGMVAFHQILLVFGGIGIQPKNPQLLAQYDGKGLVRTNEHHMHTLGTNNWTIPTICGNKPPPTHGFTLSKITDEKALMYGGQTPYGDSSDLQVANFIGDSVHWERLVPHGPEMPRARWGHAVTKIHSPLMEDQQTLLMMFGGFECRDSWLLNVGDGASWREVKNIPTPVTERFSHSINTIASSHSCVWLMAVGGYSCGSNIVTFLELNPSSNGLWELGSVLRDDEIYKGYGERFSLKFPANYQPNSLAAPTVATQRRREAQLQLQLQHAYTELQEKEQQLQQRNHEIQDKDQQIQRRDQQIQRKDQQIKEKDQRLQHFQHQVQQKDKQFQDKVQSLQYSQQQLQEKAKKIQRQDRQIRRTEQQIQRKDQEIQEKEQMLQSCRQQLQEKDKQIQDKDRQIRSTDQQIQRKDQEIHEKEQMLQHSQQQLEEKDKQIQRKDQRIQRKKQQIQRKNQQIQEEEQRLQHSQQQLQEKDRHIQRKDQEIEEKEQMVHNALQQLDKKVQQIQNQDRKIQEKKQRLKYFQQQLEEKDELIQRKNQQIQSTDEQNQRKDQEIQENEQILQQFQQELEERDKQIQEKDQHIQRKEQQIQRKDQQIQEKEQRLQYSQQQLQDKDQLILRKDQEVEEKELVLQNAQQQLQEKNQQVQEKEQNLQLLQSQVQLLHSNLPQPSTEPWVVRREELTITQEVLGSGAYGEVKVAIFRGLRVAAKLLHNIIASEYNDCLLSHEMTIAAQVRHPNLLLFIGATNEGKRSIILTELMATSLRAELDRGQIFQEHIKSIATDVSCGLNYLHMKKPDPIIHRDVSSPNVLMEPSGVASWRAKVSDYGSVVFVHEVTSTSVYPGNPSYAAPEADLPKKHSPKMDVYSFGVLLTEMKLGQQPQTTVADRARQARMVDFYPLANIIQECIDLSPDKRPTFEWVIKKLRKI